MSAGKNDLLPCTSAPAAAFSEAFVIASPLERADRVCQQYSFQENYNIPEKYGVLILLL